MSKYNFPFTLQQLFGYAKEVFIIVLGVSISFLVDKCKNNQQDEATAQGMLMNLRLDLKKDSTQLFDFKQSTHTRYVITTKLYDNLDDLAPLEDSLYFYIRALKSSSVFTPTNMTYEEMKQNGFSKLIKNQKLRRAIYELYCNDYVDLSIVSEKTGGRVEHYVIPFLEKEIPFTTNYSYSKPQIKVIKQVLKQDQFKNMIQFCKSDQFMSEEYYTTAYDRVVLILDEMRKK